MFRVPQRSIIGPLLFSIVLIDLHLTVKDINIASYANENTSYISANNVNEVIHCLEKTTDSLFKWFSDNIMKSSADKHHLLVSTNNTVNIKIGNVYTTNSTCEELLGVKLDHKLAIDDRISELCEKAGRKIQTVARVKPRMNLLKKAYL